MDHRCIFCLFRMVEDRLKGKDISNKEKTRMVHHFIEGLTNSLEEDNMPEVAATIHRQLREKLADEDPYKNEKKGANQMLMAKYDEFMEMVKRSQNSFDTALRLALAGNIIDYGPSSEFNIWDTIQDVLKREISIDHTNHLKDEISKANKIMYLGDNAGEIVLDKLFIQTIGHSEVTFAVRGKPVINDITLEDAHLVGMEEAANVISNGYDAPSTILDKSSVEFRQHFHEADIIIAKGQGNYEGLMHNYDKKIFYLLMVKCDVIAEKIGARKGDIVIYFNQSGYEF